MAIVTKILNKLRKNLMIIFVIIPWMMKFYARSKISYRKKAHERKNI